MSTALYLSIPFMFLAVIAGAIWWQSMQVAKARSWPQAEATIQSGGMEEVGHMRETVRLPCFAFSYVVNGEYYSGRFSLSGCDDRSATLIRELIDKKLTVRFDPKSPSNYQILEGMVEGCTVRLIPD
jgi:hypothetical protein